MIITRNCFSVEVFFLFFHCFDVSMFRLAWKIMFSFLLLLFLLAVLCFYIVVPCVRLHVLISFALRR